MLGHIWTSCFSASATITMHHCISLLLSTAVWFDLSNGFPRCELSRHSASTSSLPQSGDTRWGPRTRRDEACRAWRDTTRRRRDSSWRHSLSQGEYDQFTLFTDVSWSTCNEYGMVIHEHVNHGLALGDLAEYIVRIGIHNCRANALHKLCASKLPGEADHPDTTAPWNLNSTLFLSLIPPKVSRGC